MTKLRPRTMSPRAAHYGEHAPQCVATYYTYGCALLYKAREESVKSTTSKAYAGNSKASGGNVEGAPSMEEVDTEEGISLFLYL